MACPLFLSCSKLRAQRFGELMVFGQNGLLAMARLNRNAAVHPLPEIGHDKHRARYRGHVGTEFGGFFNQLRDMVIKVTEEKRREGLLFNRHLYRVFAP
ncbi:hypothetical protein GAO09_12375 [Rhizobiales bacterium RZME27]|uniref:Uncharacterized protein n=1 Tax=Endobacterium cereale TaxID=2663029 RepID=A0A6A8AC95_9HYPH|nr:hypothetical protein [Endobacterium cereale]MEB2847837.1 hypothetical protein [Endobacterium cereale]MQY46826.1 hypothetical protein [Endobacterium cereale]